MAPRDTLIDPDSGDHGEYPDISAIGMAARIPDIRDQRLGEQAEAQASATAAIRQRVLQKQGAEVPVAAFQSYI